MGRLYWRHFFVNLNFLFAEVSSNSKCGFEKENKKGKIIFNDEMFYIILGLMKESAHIYEPRPACDVFGVIQSPSALVLNL